ncbi:MAG: hypothetical protein ABI859_15735 [Pseudomonadota bacterium]
METAPQSSFITVLAWLTLGGGVLGIVSGVLQGVLSTVVMPTLLPELGGAVTTLLPGLTFISLALSVFSVWVGVRLLQRRDWARRAMVILLAIGMAFAAAGVFVCLTATTLIDGRLLALAGLPDEFFPLFRAMMIVIGAGCLAVVGVHVWLIARLRSAVIRAEFVA